MQLITVILWMLCVSRFCMSAFLFSLDELTPKQKLSLCIELQDPYGAQIQLQKIAKTDPDYLDLQLKSLALYKNRDGNRVLLRVLLEELQKNKNIALQPQTLETVCLSCIQLGAESQKPQIRFESAIAAAQSGLAEGITLLEKLSQDHHSGIRRLVFQIGGQLADQELTDLAIESLDKEASFEVRLEAIRYLGNHEGNKVRLALNKHLRKESLHPEERIEILAAFKNHCTDEDAIFIESLAKSQDPFDRILACYIASNINSKRAMNTILPLLTDDHESVSIQALETLGYKITSWDKQLPEPKSAHHQIGQNWFMARCNDPMGLNNLEKNLYSQIQKERLWALSRLMSLGFSPSSAALTHSDPLVRLNALRHAIMWGETKWCQELLDTLFSLNGYLSEQQEGSFTWLDLNQIEHSSLIPHLPETEDLLTRLELIALVSRSSTIDTKPYLRQFLKKRTLGIAAETALLFSGEFEHEGLEELETLCFDPERSIRIQAAVILGVLLHQEKALSILIQEYPESKPDMKALILIAIGGIGHKSAIPFLTNSLLEESELLRIRASSALLSCLNG